MSPLRCPPPLFLIVGIVALNDSGLSSDKLSLSSHHDIQSGESLPRLCCQFRILSFVAKNEVLQWQTVSHITPKTCMMLRGFMWSRKMFRKFFSSFKFPVRREQSSACCPLFPVLVLSVSRKQVLLGVTSQQSYLETEALMTGYLAVGRRGKSNCISI